MAQKHEKSASITKLLNLCDRVDVLDEIVCDDEHVLVRDRFDALMEPFYPSLENFFRDVKDEENIVAIQTSFTDTSVTFTTKFDDESEKVFTYDQTDDNAS